MNNDTVFEAIVLDMTDMNPPPPPPPPRCMAMSTVPRIMTGPENQHLLRKPRAASNLEAYADIQKCFLNTHRADSQLRSDLAPYQRHE